MRLTVREAARAHKLWYPVAFAAVTAGVAWSAWSGPIGDSAVAINRTDVLAIAAILAGLAWISRWTRGPVAAARWTRLVRTGGYAAVLALVLAKSAVERVAMLHPTTLREDRPWPGQARRSSSR
jgi:hypothetical protein